MSSTGKVPNCIRHTYNVIKVLKSYSIYSLSQVDWNKNQLTDIIRIEKFRGMSNASNINHYLRLRNTSNWKSCELVTGLRPTKIKGIFYGDRQQPHQIKTGNKTLLIFGFTNDTKMLFIDVCRGFYPNHNGILNIIINAYKSN